jgi:hypothetical protein
MSLIEDIESFLEKLRKNPRRMVILLLGALGVFITLEFIKSYVGKKAERFAAPDRPPAVAQNTAPIELLDYEMGTERANDREYDDYIKIYNRSSNSVFLESIELRADMGDGLFRQAILYDTQKPEPLVPGSFQEFRYRLKNTTDKDTAREASPQYASFTGKSFAYVYTTNGLALKFETHYHPYLIDRLKMDRAQVVSKKSAITVR